LKYSVGSENSSRRGFSPKRWIMVIRHLIELAEADEIARRYFVMNAFDGALTILGVIIGAFVGGAVDPKVIISAGVGASLAMGLSGGIGAYMAERAERGRALKELEAHMFRDLQNTVIGRASRAAAYWVAFVDAISPAAAALIPLFPLILAQLRLIPVDMAMLASIALNMATLFVLGAFLGRTSKENIWVHGMIMMGAGALVATLLFLFLRA
jgi:predicted membrane protein (TIGR00267 family)